jgi:ribulose-5-phosphate 4-epimerase/fuculose-1-phosphate aldolase
MTEVYIGTKFRTVFARREAPADPRVGELVDWCHRWARLGVVGDTVGNLSFRSANGFIINRTAGDLATITAAEFVEVLRADFMRRELTVAGAYEPSSESLMHAALYAARPAVNAVFHGHSAALLEAAERLGLPVTHRERPYGTPALADEILDVLSAHAVVIMRNHGYVAIGPTMAAAHAAAERVMGKL